MAKVVLPLLGIHFAQGTPLVLTAEAIASDGTVSDSAYSVILATTPPSSSNVTRAIRYTDSPQSQEINALNTFQLNEVNIANGDTLEIDIFKVNNTSHSDALLYLLTVAPSDYFKAQWSEGTASGSIATCTFYGIRGDFQSGMEGRGEQIASLQLKPVDMGIPQFSVTWS